MNIEAEHSSETSVDLSNYTALSLSACGSISRKDTLLILQRREGTALQCAKGNGENRPRIMPMFSALVVYADGPWLIAWPSLRWRIVHATSSTETPYARVTTVIGANLM
jgi:hypothetical protein